jgi:signal transduction histidine kinase
VALRDSRGRVTGLVGINRDISKRKWAEEQLHQLNLDLARNQKELLVTYGNLKRANDELKEAQFKLIQVEKLESIGRLAAGVAHEVKNPLATLLMGLDYLAESFPDKGEDVAMTMAQMQEAVKRADAIIRGLLDFASSGQLEIAETSPNSIVEQSLLLVYHELRQKRIQVAKRLAADLPRLRLDRRRIEQVLINLFANAIAAMPPNGELRISSTAEKETDGRGKVVLTVEDNGPGIPPEVLPRVFDPFFSTKPTGMGQGLGLAVARNILDMHGGKIEMSNRPEGGARATVTFYT